MGRVELQQRLKHEQEAIEMMVIAYQAVSIKAVLKDVQKYENNRDTAEKYIHDEFKNLLINMEGGQAFSPERAEHIAQRYTPLAVLDKDGAGAIIFRDATDNQNIIAVRGTDLPSNTQADISADAGIAVSFLPTHQFVNHLNDLSIHVAVH